MKHLFFTTRCALAVLAILPGVSFAQSIPFVNPASLATTAVNNPSALNTKATSELRTSAITASNATMKDIGGGFSVTSLGTIVQNTTKNPVALVDSTGNVVSATTGKLDGQLQTSLNRLMSGVSLPAGFGSNDRTSTTFLQKNTYAAATDNANVYYGGGAGSSANSVVSAIVHAATNNTNTVSAASLPPVHVLSGSNQIVGDNGVVVANFNPSTGQFTTTSGAAVDPSSAEFAQYKAALASSGTKTALLSQTTTSGSQIR